MINTKLLKVRPFSDHPILVFDETAAHTIVKGLWVGVIFVSAFVATVDSTHLKFVQQADLKTQMEDLEYRNDTKMDLTNHDTQKQVSHLP